MRVSTTIVGLVGALAGSAVAVAGYQHTAALDALVPRTSPAAVAVGRPLPAAPPRIRVKMAPCSAPARLVRGACVTTVTHTRVVVDPAPAAPAAPAAPVAPVAPAAVPAAPVVRPAATAPRRVVRPHRAGDDSAEHEGQRGSEPGDD
jgi:hypothetical protein